MPGRPDRAGQRAGHRRPLRALRRRGGAAPAHPVVLPHHRLRPAAARRHGRADRLARARADPAAQLDRALRGRAGDLPRAGRRRGDPGLHHPPRHPLRGHLLRAGARAPGRRAPGRRPPRGRPRPPLRRRRRAGVGRRPRRRRGAQDRRLHRPLRDQPGQRRGPPGLGRRLRADGLRHRGDHGRPRPRRARLRLRAGPRPAGAARHRPRGRARRRAAGGALRRPGAAGELGVPRRHGGRRGHAGRQRVAAGARAGRGDGRLPPARLAHLAPALLGRPDPGHPLPRARRGAGPGRGPAGAAAPGQRLRAQGAEPAGGRTRSGSRWRARSAAARRGARPTPWTRSSTRPGTSCATPPPT